MGIDKPDVRTVIHYDVPDCLENYYQEAGRAGRDNKRSYAVVLYNAEDENDLKNLANIRFPPIKEMKSIYQSLVDYLQIPVGSGEGIFYDFNLNEFIKNFQLNIFKVMGTLKMLEQEGYISFNETVFLPSQVCFTSSKEWLEDFEQTHPQLDPLIKCLLRTYEGIYDNRVSIHEKQLSRLLKKPIDAVKQQLQQLHSLGIIEYQPQKETPQIYFVTNRAPAKYLVINYDRYRERRKDFEQRVETMLRFLHDHTSCRSRFIASYFGDMSPEDCGICDNCLKRKSTAITEEDFIKIKNHIFQKLNGGKTAIQQLLQSSKGWNKVKFWKVMEHLQAEKMIEVDSNGIIRKTEK
jgi:ATP-dependent DNA helicase RecQ